VLTGSDDGRHSNTSLAWGAGVQFNPTESVAIDIAYEGSGCCRSGNCNGGRNLIAGSLEKVSGVAEPC
ncbi:Ail/Lom family outer membrane beta-barrel protein, partial [Escherichia coli]